MSHVENTAQLLARLEAIGTVLAEREGTLALLALGSIGQDTDRLDRYSDLDFFVIVEPGYKKAYIDSLDWLEAVAPLGFSFANTIDGHKALYADGVFCEFAVFEPSELEAIPFESGRVVWKRDAFDASMLTPAARPAGFGAGDESFLLGELLSNLYVGLGRFARGEKLSAAIFVQNYAVARLIDLLELWGEAKADNSDPFANDRRVEQRFPQHVALIESITPGYRGTPAAAVRMLDFLERRSALNEYIVAEIRRLVEEAEDK